MFQIVAWLNGVWVELTIILIVGIIALEAIGKVLSVSDTATAPTPAPAGSLMVGITPTRQQGVDMNYYILTCEHGITELHEVNGIDEHTVMTRLVKEHHDRLEDCGCEP